MQNPKSADGSMGAQMGSSSGELQSLKAKMRERERERERVRAFLMTGYGDFQAIGNKNPLLTVH